MKRGREEDKEGEGQQQEQKKQGAPVAASLAPTRNSNHNNQTGPAAAVASSTPSETEETSDPRSLLTIFDAAEFVVNVRRELEPEKVRQFLHVGSQMDIIGPLGVIHAIKVLLRGHPGLKVQFNKFLPTEYKISLDDDDEQDRPEEVPPALQESGASPSARGFA